MKFLAVSGVGDFKYKSKNPLLNMTFRPDNLPKKTK